MLNMSNAHHMKIGSDYRLDQYENDNAFAYVLGTPHVVHAVEAEGGERPLDGGAFGISDAGTELHFHARLEPHAVAPYQSCNERPVTRS